MKRNTKLIRNLIIAVFSISLILGLGAFIGIKAKAADDSKTVDIVFTHDLHSYLKDYAADVNGEVKNIGGMARLSTVISEKKAENPDTLVLDAGDYPMGTLYQALYATDALEYRMLSELSFDATTFGNHDFDYGTDAMVSQFTAAKENCDYYPDFIINNIDWSVGDEPTNKLYNVLKDMNLKDYAIYERNGLKIGVTGVLGYDAIDCAPTCELTTLDPIEATRKTVDEMIEKENPDMIICISHSGTDPDPDKSEDEALAKAVPEIDVIISGHTHTVLEEPIIVGDTIICSCGCYGQYTGFVSVERNDNGRYSLGEYELIEMDDSIEQDQHINDILDGYEEDINNGYLTNYGYKCSDVIGSSDFNFDSVDSVYYEHTEHNLGDLIADAYRWKADETDTGCDTPFAVSVAPSGTIRGTFLKGDITVANAFEAFSLGIGEDGTVGYPLIEIYLTGEELRTVCEVDASISDLMTAARLYMSGLEFSFNENRMILNKVIDAHLNPTLHDDSAYEEIDDEELYRVVSDMYSGLMLSKVTSMSYGILSIVPKDKDGNEITDFNDAIIHDATDGKEVKAWVAIADYIKYLNDSGEGLNYYVNTHERKTVDDSNNIIDILKNPNKYFFAIAGIGIVLILILFLIVKLLVSLIKKIIFKINKSNKNKSATSKNEEKQKENSK